MWLNKVLGGVSVAGDSAAMICAKKALLQLVELYFILALISHAQAAFVISFKAT